MHYNKSPMLRFFNALFEFILLVVVFIIAGALRSVSPIGSRFHGGVTAGAVIL